MITPGHIQADVLGFSIGDALFNGATYLAAVDGPSPVNVINGQIGVRSDAVDKILSIPTVHGLPATITEGSNCIIIASDADTLIPDSTCTIALIRRKRDTTARNSSPFGYNNGASDRAMLQAPYSDGNLYWDFGNATTGAGGGRLTISGQTWDTRLDFLIAIAGPNKGREVWRNGAKIGSDATATATRSATTKQFTIGFNGDNGIASDREEIYFLAIIPREWSDDECRAWYVKAQRNVSINAWNKPIGRGLILPPGGANLSSTGAGTAAFTSISVASLNISGSSVVNFESDDGATLNSGGTSFVNFDTSFKNIVETQFTMNGVSSEILYGCPTWATSANNCPTWDDFESPCNC
jgi:hypothetical protein